MPEMLWAVLLCETFDRTTYLAGFRELISLCAKWFRPTPKEGEEPKVQNELPRGHDGGMDFDCVVDQTTLAQVQDEQLQAFIEVPLRHPLGFAALRPLLLLEYLPGRERWKAALSSPSAWPGGFVEEAQFSRAVRQRGHPFGDALAQKHRAAREDSPARTAPQHWCRSNHLPVQ